MSNKGIGSIKDYTPNFNFIIPKFDIATWHDYMESNFRSIDALFYNLFGINNYSGEWTQLTVYTVGQVLYIGKDIKDGEETIYSGRLVKVLVEHTTDNSEYFNIYYEQYPEYYELFADASTAQIYAQQAQQSATNALQSEQKAKQSETNAKSSENVAIQKANAASNSANTAQQIATDFNINAENKTNIVNIIAQEAQTSANNAKQSETNAKNSEIAAANSAASINDDNIVHKTGNEMIYGYKTFRNDNSAASVFIQGYLGLSENPAISGGQAQLEFHDKNGAWEGIVGVERYTNGQRLLKFQLKDQDGVQNKIELVRDPNGVWYATCPTPPTTNNSKAIATTAWVRQVAALKDLSNVSSNIDYIVEQGGDNYQWYRIYKSGRLEQGGIYDNKTSSSTIRQQILLLKPYQHQNYSITVTPMNDRCRGTVSGKIVSTTALELQYTGDYGVIDETEHCRYLSWKTDEAKGN